MKAQYKLGTVVEINLPETDGTSFLRIEEISLSQNGVNYSGLINGQAVSFGEGSIVSAYRPAYVRSAVKSGGTTKGVRGNRKSKKGLTNGATTLAQGGETTSDVAQQ